MAARDAGAAAIIPLSPYQVNVNYGIGSSGIVRGTGADWFGPLNPMAPIAPKEVAGRVWDFPTGYNLQQRPRGYEPISFGTLRALADSFDILRLVIETRKDQVARLKWKISPKVPGGGKAPKISTAMQAKIDEITTFFERPDRVTRWRVWIRQLLEDLFVIDAPTLYCERNRGGDLIGLIPLDGATIKRVIDDWGRTPQPYDDGGVTIYPPAYQQVLKGFSAVDYSVRDLVYAPQNLRAHKSYGYSPVEQVIVTVNIALRRQLFQLSYYTEGNVPEALIGTPDTWTPEQIATFQDHWDLALSGNLAQRRRARFVPGGIAKTFIPTKEIDLTGKADEWFARVVCYAFSIPPQAFVAQVNRATAETHKEAAEEEGLEPTKNWIIDVHGDIIAKEFDAPELGLVFDEEEAIDPVKQSEIQTTYVKAGARTINQLRASIGDDPDPDPAADKLMVLTANGYVPINSNVGDDGEVIRDTPADGVLPIEDPLGKSAKRSRRPAPVPFERPATRKARKSLAAIYLRAFRKARKSVAGQVSSALEKVAKAKKPRSIVDDIDFDFPSEKDIAEILKSLNVDSGKRALAQLGVDDRSELVDQVNDRAALLAGEQAAELVSGIDENTRDELADIIADGLDENIGTDAIAERIQEATGFSDDRSDLIARTEVTDANSEAALESYQVARDDGVNVRKEWILGPNPCEICEENEAAGPIDLEDEFPSGDDAPSAHPNCECALSPVVDDDTEKLAKNEDSPHDEKGRFASTGSAARTALAWIKSDAVKDKASELVLQAIAFGINSLIAHGTGTHGSYNDSHIEEAVNHTVNHFATTAQLTALQAKSTLQTAVKGLIAIRQAHAAMRKHRDPVLHTLFLFLKALDAFDPKKHED